MAHPTSAHRISTEGAQFVSGQPDLWGDDAPIEQDSYMTDLITRRAVEFINQNATRPFFIDVAVNAPHSPTQRPDNAGRTPAPVVPHVPTTLR